MKIMNIGSVCESLPPPRRTNMVIRSQLGIFFVYLTSQPQQNSRVLPFSTLIKKCISSMLKRSASSTALEEIRFFSSPQCPATSCCTCSFFTGLTEWLPIIWALVSIRCQSVSVCIQRGVTRACSGFLLTDQSCFSWNCRNTNVAKDSKREQIVLSS